MHTSKPLSDKGWAEQEMASLPNVKISLKLLACRMQQLLASHNGILPLPRYVFDLYRTLYNTIIQRIMVLIQDTCYNLLNNFSLPNCYEAEFKEQLEIIENGVPLEHLVSCLSCVELKQDTGSVKYIIWIGKKDLENNHDGNYFRIS